ncbi:MAG: alpha/beta hydrolase [Flavisolibacter sp.]
MQKKTILFKDKNLSYSAGGRGMVVMLVHGFGEDRGIWNQQLPALLKFKVITPDLPGSGLSESHFEMSMELLADSLKAILEVELTNLDDQQPEKVILIGHSMGGYVSLAFAEKYSSYLKGLGLVHSTSYADSAAKIESRIKGIDFIRCHGANSFLKTTIPNLYSPATQKHNYHLIQQQIDALHNFLPEALVSYYEAMIKRRDRSDILKKTNLPLLLLFGQYDSAIPLQEGLKQCFLSDFSYIGILKESGHMGMREEPEKTSQILLAYLNTIDLIQ